MSIRSKKSRIFSDSDNFALRQTLTFKESLRLKKVSFPFPLVVELPAQHNIKHNNEPVRFNSVALRFDFAAGRRRDFFSKFQIVFTHSPLILSALEHL